MGYDYQTALVQLSQFKKNLFKIGSSNPKGCAAKDSIVNRCEMMQIVSPLFSASIFHISFISLFYSHGICHLNVVLKPNFPLKEVQ